MTKFFGALVSLGCLLGATAAQAQSYPSMQITLVVTAAAGGVTDVVAICSTAAREQGQRVVIENRGGAYILGAQAVAKVSPTATR
jgi:tripartite-type tricarboxylate transporter receptor subunit TctC